MAGEAGVVDRLVVAVDYAYDQAGASAIEADFAHIKSLSTGLLASVAALMAGAVYETAELGDSMAKTARSLEMSVESYSELSYAADMAGASEEVMRTGMIALTRQMAAMREGTGPAADAARKLGFQQKVANGEIGTAAELLPVLADALNGVKNDGERAALSLLLLGEAGPKMRSLLVEGSAGLQKMSDRAHALGIVVSDADAALSEEFMDSLADIGNIGRSIGGNIGFGLMPPLLKVTRAIGDWYVANGGIIDQQMDRVIGVTARALDELQTPAGKAVATASALAAAWGAAGVAKSMYGAASAASPLIAALGGQAGAALSAAKSGGPLAAAAVLVTAALDDLTMAAEGNDSILLRLGETMGAKGETQRAAAGLISLFWAGVDATTAWNDVIQTKFLGTLDALAEALNPLAAMQPLFDALGVVVPDIEIPSAKQVIGGAAEAMEGASNALNLGARAARGDLSETDRLVLEQFTAPVVSGLSAALAPQYVQPTVSIQVQAATSPAEIARIAGEQARAEVERQTLEALLSAEQSP